MSIEFPEKLRFLFDKHRYKVAYGGRGSAKSWSFARALLVQAAAKPLRVLCTREVQKSIKDSVHRLLSDQVESMGLGSFYEVMNDEIRGKNGSLFLFAGLSSHTVESIKSYEGVDIVWVEEAHKVTRKSWSILIPTIRKAGSEIWISFNPELDDDETYTRFVVNTPPDCRVEKVNHSDNPWFPEVLKQELEHARATLSADEFGNIWEGNCRAALDGAIYAGEIREATEKGRICNVPYDAKLKTHVIFDLGWNDSTSIILAQRHLSEIRVIDFIEDDHKTLDWYSAELVSKRLNWGKMWLPHDGSHKDMKTGASAEEIMKKLGWKVGIVPNIQIEAGIKQAKMSFAQCYFDKSKANGLVQHLKRYRRNIPTTTGEPGAPVHDEHSHAADAFRYMSIIAREMRNETESSGKIKYPNLGII